MHEELSKNDEALEFFNSINPSSKRFVLRWIKLAKTEKTRTNRILELVELSAKGEKLPGS
ncbi:YdeI/OmpD-associated family protein [Leeuwenhoekiella sp. H156]|uniref:YdeI/OmpD-associated family protein n=1 Tax=Leeuwenhoekiella sp. H156 TaxID=3450128 RepID=UPI003FA46296